ncbi:MAG: putative bifunctional diguanylate cyclase/phosphodiesterase [Acidimicrobiales bacterium]
MSSLISPSESRASRLFAVLGCALLIADRARLLGPLAEFTFVIVGAGTMAACVVGVRRHHPRLRWPWAVVMCSIVVFVAGGALRLVEGTFGDLSPTRSLLPDFLTIPGYGLVAACFIGMMRARNANGRRDLDALLDSAVVGLGLMTLAWSYLMTPALFAEDVTLKVRLSLVVYPPISMFITALGMRVAAGNGSRVVVAQRLILVTALGLLTGDVLTTVGDARIAAVPLSIAEVPYILAFLAFGSMSLHPSMRELTEPAGVRGDPPMRARLVLTGVALALPALVALAGGGKAGGELVVLAGMVLAMTAASVLRVLRALRAQAESQARLRYEATHDILTGLPNRSMAMSLLSERMSDEHRASLTVVFLDLDRFKLVNDSGGHALGDQLLVGVAARLRSASPAGALIARIGGDEFLLVFEGLGSQAQAVERTETVRAAFQQPFSLGGNEVFSSASCGLVYLDERSPHSFEPDGLIRDADTAMYRAKAAGRDGIAVFDSRMRDETSERVRLEQDLRRALERSELEVHFQSIVSLRTHVIEGFEALVRWQHHSRGLISPTVFIPIAEESDLIIEIGDWVLREAVGQLARWRLLAPEHAGLYVAVNFSSRQLRMPSVTQVVASALRDSDLAPDGLCIEITESLLMQDTDAVAETLRDLRRLGVKLSIDDFGTGYSSLSYLHRFPLDQVKIDRSFVEDLESKDGVGAKLVAAIIAMSGAMGMRTVAEGVETARQGRRLLEMGADRAQGYYFSRPLPASAVPALLAGRSGVPSSTAAEAQGIRRSSTLSTVNAPHR